VTGLYVYAIVGAHLHEPPGQGLAGEPLRLVGSGAVQAIAGEMAYPRPDAAALAAHDATVRRLSTLTSALLPARFGQWLADERALVDWLTAHASELAEALSLVAGRVQMTLRVFAGADAQEPPTQVDSSDLDGGPGTRYLERRRREAERERSLPEIAPLRDALRPLLHGERIERPAAPGRLRATAYDLIDGGAVADYSRIVSAAAPHLAGVRVTASGPWPPYAFAPRPLA
jgi:hypothetical protein